MPIILSFKQLIGRYQHLVAKYFCQLYTDDKSFLVIIFCFRVDLFPVMSTDGLVYFLTYKRWLKPHTSFHWINSIHMNTFVSWKMNNYSSILGLGVLFKKLLAQLHATAFLSHMENICTSARYFTNKSGLVHTTSFIPPMYQIRKANKIKRI